MDTSVLRAVVFYIEVCFVLSQSQGNHVFQSIIRNVSMTKHFFRLKLEWDVHGDSKAYAPETVLIFNIQVNQTEKNRIVLNTNYSVALSKINQTLEWSWDPLVPLQCDPHVIRIRSLVVDKNVPRSWSNWSPWKGVTGLPTLDDNEYYIFPDEQTVKAGSNVTFCCITKKTDRLLALHYSAVTFTNTTDRKIYFNLKNVSQSDTNVICENQNEPKGTTLNVIGLPKKPKDFTCKTEEKIVTCSWRTEKKDPRHKMCETELILTDISSGKTYCKKPLKKEEEDSCSFTTGEEQIPNLRLTAENCFGKTYTDYPSETYTYGYPSEETHSAEQDTMLIILLLGTLSLLLFMCICFCSIYCIRHRCFSTIPKPEVSPFLKRNPGTMEVYDVDPDKLEVMENHQTCTAKQYSLGMLVIENITYFDPAYNPTLQEKEAKSKNLNPPSSYQPLQDFFAVSQPSTSYKPLQDFFENEPIVQPQPQDGGNFSYTSGMEISNSVAQLVDLPGLQPEVYKPQQVTKLETISPH